MEGFTEIKLDKWKAIVKKGWEERVEKLISLWHLEKTGRRGILKDPDGKILGRLYGRGGILGRLLKKLFWFELNRAIRELEITQKLFEKGFPVPEPVGISVKVQFPFVEAILFTKKVEGTSLEESIRNGKRDVIKNVGSLIASLHKEGIYHPDLNVGNFIVGGDTVFVLDFDKFTRKKVFTKKDKEKQLARFIKSMMKEGIYRNGDDKLLLEGYGEELRIKLRKTLWKIGWALGL